MALIVGSPFPAACRSPLHECSKSKLLEDRHSAQKPDKIPDKNPRNTMGLRPLLGTAIQPPKGELTMAENNLAPKALLTPKSAGSATEAAR